MLIECRHRRLTGSTTVFNGIEENEPGIVYRFWPRNEKGESLPIRDPEAIKNAPHVCEVRMIQHQRRLIMECAPSFVPHGPEAEKEAAERFGWRRGQGVPPPVTKVTPRPQAVKALPVDDEDETSDEEGLETEAEAAADTIPPPIVEDNLPARSKEEWEKWANDVGLDPNNKPALIKYARDNYGVDLSPRRGNIYLIREIYLAAKQAADDAA